SMLLSLLRFPGLLASWRSCRIDHRLSVAARSRWTQVGDRRVMAARGVTTPLSTRRCPASSFHVHRELRSRSSRGSVLRDDSIIALSYAETTRPIGPRGHRRAAGSRRPTTCTASAVRVQHGLAGTLPASPSCHRGRIDDKLRAQMVGNRPAGNAPPLGAEHGGLKVMVKSIPDDVV